MNAKTMGWMCLSMCLTAGGVFGAGPWYVATNGVSPWDGTTWATAFTNVQQALNTAANGETIYIAGHGFPLTNQLSWASKGLTILGGYAADGGTPGALTNTPTLLYRSAGTDVRILNIAGVTNGTLQNVTVSGGSLSVSANGGGILVSSCSNLTLAACTIVNNTVSMTSASGGGLYLSGSSLLLTNCVVASNLVVGANQNASYGGGIYLASGMLSMRDSVVDANYAQYGTNPNGQSKGGGLYVSAGTGTLVNCLFYNNEAGYLYSHDSSTAPIVTVTGYGDGIYVNGGVLRVNSTTIACHPNTGIYQNGGAVAVTNSILWYNFDDLVGVPAGNLGYCDIQTGDNNGTNGCFSVDPLLEYGFYLNPNSPCVSTGNVSAAAAGLNGRTTRVDGTLDTNAKVNLGYHSPAGFDLTYADIYVATNGADANSGTNALQPFATLTNAFALARNGTRIHVAAGNYTTNGTAFPLTIQKQIGFQLLGTNSSATVINAAGANQRVLSLSYVGGVCRVEGLTFTGGKQTAASPGQWSGTQGGGLWINDCSSVTLASCVLTNNTASSSSGKSYGGALYVYGSQVVMTNCLVLYNTCTEGTQDSGFGSGVYFLGHALTVANTVLAGNYVTYGGNPTGGQYAYGGGLYMSYGSASLFNCLLNNNDAYGTVYPANTHGDGIYVRSGVFGANSCTIAGNVGEGIYLNSGTVGITNSILWNNAIDLVNVPAASLAYCDTQNGGTNGTNGCFSSDPIFSGGYYLNPGSPCVNTGNVTAATAGLGSLTTRVDGTPDSGTLDLGYHYAAGLAGVLYDNVYVAPAPAGNDSNNGTNALAPFATLTKALSVAGNGTRVHIAAGVYTTNSVETFPLTISQLSSVQLLGTNRATTVIKATGATRRVLTLNHVSGTCRIEGLTLTGGKETSASLGGGIFVNICPDVTIAACAITNNTLAPGNNASYGGGVYATASTLTLTNCLVEGNTIYGGNQANSYGGGVGFQGINLTVRDSVIDANKAVSGANGNFSEYGAGLYMDAGSAALVNSLVYKNDCVLANGQSQAAYPYGDGVYVNGGALQILSSTIATNIGQGIFRSAGTVAVTNSIVWNNGMDVTGTVALAWSDVGVWDAAATRTNCISADPLFQNAAANDFRLLAKSPCVNAGTNQDWMTGALDLAGAPRIQNKRVDMGAYEAFVASAGTAIQFR